MCDPAFLDEAPRGGLLTDYDKNHVLLYEKIVEASWSGRSSGEIARDIFAIDPLREPERARRVVESHLKRAHWFRSTGYRLLFSRRGPAQRNLYAM